VPPLSEMGETGTDGRKTEAKEETGLAGDDSQKGKDRGGWGPGDFCESYA